MTRVALIRHYPTAWNAEARLQGQTDVPLSDAAREMLAGLAMPAPWNRARIIASPLSRAAETARLLAGGREVRLDPRLVELSWGDWEGQRAADLLGDPSIGFRPTHEWDDDTRAPGGETPGEAWRRLRPALADIASDPAPAVLVLHKALMRVILQRAWAGRDAPEIKRGRLYALDLDATGWPGDPAEPVRLVAR